MRFFKLLTVIIINVFIICDNKGNQNICMASHSGSWYQSNPKLLSEEIKHYLLKTEKIKKNVNLKSIIVPHAGYRFSGPTAVKSFININPSDFDHVIILGSSHHEYFNGCGLTPFEMLSTPELEIHFFVWQVFS